MEGFQRPLLPTGHEGSKAPPMINPTCPRAPWPHVLRSSRDGVSNCRCLRPSAGRAPGGGQMGGECRPLPQHALDRQPPAVAVEDVLDQRQAQPPAALCAAFRHLHPLQPPPPPPPL